MKQKLDFWVISISIFTLWPKVFFTKHLFHVYLYSPYIIFLNKIKNHQDPFRSGAVAPWCSGYHYCTTSSIKAWTQVPHRFKFCSRRVGNLRWWGSLSMVPAGNKATRLSSVNNTTKTIYHQSRTLLSSEFTILTLLILVNGENQIIAFFTLSKTTCRYLLCRIYKT